MSNEPLSEQDAQKLFNQVSKAMDDPVKLNELMKSETIEEVVEEPVVETPTEEVVVEEPVVTPPEDDKSTAEEVAEVEEPAKPEEKSELEVLKEQLAKVAKENHALRSQAGRVPHVQKRLIELDKKLEALEKKSTSPSDHPSARIQPKVLEALKGIKETDPDLADTIAKAIEQATNGVAEEMHAREKETLTLLRTQELTDYQDAEVARLLERYPNAPEVFASPHWDEWKKGQSQAVLTLAKSDSADDVAFVFEKYTNDMLAKYPELAEKKEEQVVTPAPSESVSEKAKQIEEERARKKTTAVSTSSANAPAAVAMPDDPQALFEKYSQQIRKDRLG